MLLTLDFETYFAKDYTIAAMTTESYVRDPRFETLGCAFICDGKKWWVDGPELDEYLQTIDWAQTDVLAHHAQFDGLILSHHYGIKPRKWYDTLSMARLQLGVHLSVGLDSLSRHFGLDAKTVPYNEFKGKRFADLSSDLLRRLAAGALHDCELTLDIFNRLCVDFPQGEFQTIDTTIRMFTEPCLEGDIDLFGEVWLEEEARRREGLAQLGVTEKELQSADGFTKALEAEGVEIQYKAGKNQMIPAFAKTDAFMEELQEHDNPRVQALARARLGIKSTIDQTRAERFGYMATRGSLPVYLRYCGAHTTRWSGGDGVNWQNLRRGGKLRKAIKAPPGCTLVIVDKSQIECRILNEFAGQADVIERFRNKVDPYISIASAAYDRPITKDDKAERGTGKQLELSCGYGAGGPTIQQTARLGIYGPPVIIDIDTAEGWKHLYRNTHLHVVDLWKEAENIIRRMYAFESCRWGPLEIMCEQSVGTRRIRLPGCADIHYDSLEWHHPTPEEIEKFGEARPYWRVRTRRGWPTKLYGAKLVENVVQYMARINISEDMNVITSWGIKIATTTHDELVGVVPLDMGQKAYDMMSAQMCTPPAWMPNIPLDAEGAISERYEK